MPGILEILNDSIALAAADASARRRIENERAEQERLDAIEADQAAACADIEQMLVEKLHSELREEIAERCQPYSPATLKAYRRDFARFKETARKNGLPYLPASPELIALHLTLQIEQGIKVLTRITAAISATHRLADLADPTKDPLVGAVIRFAKKVEQDDHGSN